LDDRYRLDERIAAGGVGQVWRATDLLLERAVAVKVLRPEYADHPETLERFRKEARNAGALSDSHVAQVYDYGPSGPEGSPYLVMEFVDGPSLADLLAADPIEPAQALDVIAQAAEGLAAAHKAGVVHRDIKPGNILISREGRVKVTDFGIAYAAGQAPVTAPGLVMGTTQYMAPERIAGNPGTAASDLYALGIVLHECLTGMPPHDGTAADVMAAHLYLPLPPLPANVPAELDVLVDRLTAKDPAKRIRDARELADLAARIRDAIGGGANVPPARAAAQSGPGGAVPSPVPQAPALAAGPGYGSADGSGQAGADPYGTGSTGGTGNTTLLAAADVFAGHAYVSGEWDAPPRMSQPTSPPDPWQPDPRQPGQPQGNPRRRGVAAVAVGAAAVASVGLVALLVSGAFSGSPTAHQTPAGPSTASISATSQTPSHSASGTARPSGPGGGAANPSSVATSAATSQKATPGGKKPSASPTGRPSTGSPASSTLSGSGSGAPSGGTSSGSPSTSSATSPSGTPTPSTSGSPSPSPTSCFLGICL
jgi:serine/threonine-protein kinase